MADFSTDIQQFQQGGIYEYKFDSVGNLYFNSSSTDFSQVYLSLPLANIVYNNSKIEKFYDPEFQEFVPNTGSAELTSSIEALQQQLNVINEENTTLKGQLDSLIAQSAATAESSGPNQVAIKQVILELRKTLGQGRVDSDFSDSFPYTPIKKAEPST
jgi:hypothetical protein